MTAPSVGKRRAHDYLSVIHARLERVWRAQVGKQAVACERIAAASPLARRAAAGGSLRAGLIVRIAEITDVPRSAVRVGDASLVDGAAIRATGPAPGRRVLAAVRVIERLAVLRGARVVDGRVARARAGSAVEGDGDCNGSRDSC